MKSLIETVNEFCDAHLAPPEVEAPPTAADLLRRAAYRVGQPGAWCRDYLGLYEDGRGTYASEVLGEGTIRSRCMLGALYAERNWTPSLNNDTVHAAYEAIVQAVGTSLIAEWNDAPTRTQDQVVAALIKASEIAEAEA